MRGFRHGFVLILLLAGALVSAADTAATKAERLEFPDGTVITLTHPETWQFQRTPPNGKFPPSIKLTGDSGGSFSLQLSFMPDTPNRPDTQEKVDQMVTLAGAQYEGGSVEKKITVKRLTCTKGLGSYAPFTDADLVGKEVTPGQVRVVATGVVVYGKAFGIFTLLEDSVDQPGFKEALRVLTEGIAPK
ncbi:MAG TPA: hypothetical protein VHX44_11815 [Planctomycetota bacterium]|nr:hypothetical protein [Planctomycetota bacterium]